LDKNIKDFKEGSPLGGENQSLFEIVKRDAWKERE